MNDQVKKIKTAMQALEYMVDYTQQMIGGHGASTKGEYITTIKEKKNGRKKGHYARLASIVDSGWELGNCQGKVLEYVEFYPKGDVDKFTLKMSFGKNFEKLWASKAEVRENVSIEAWMTMADTQLGVMYGKYDMDNIEEVLNYKGGNNYEQRFVKEINELIVDAVKKGKEEILIYLFGK